MIKRYDIRPRKKRQEGEAAPPSSPAGEPEAGQ
jgi:hypothetical protein